MSKTQVLQFLKSRFWELTLFIFCLGLLFVTIKMNVFRYNNFDYGKFDLGNMTQMVWNTMNGRFMWLTDHFGTNLPRWAMSHVDPILILFVPIFYFFQTPLTLVISQLILVIFSAFVIYKIAQFELKSNFVAFCFGLGFLFYPAIGFLLAWTGFHGITAVIPFFLLAFYVFEKYVNTNPSKISYIVFWIFVILSLAGKEEVSLFILLLGVFILFFRKRKILGLSLTFVGLAWFIVTFMIIIPHFSHYRIEGYKRFTQNTGIDTDLKKDVVSPNFFLNRYESFGDSYLEIGLNMISQPRNLVRILLGGDKLENLNQTLSPMAYSSVLYLPLFVISGPEFLINYSTTQTGVGTSEIINHRISLIIPVLFISSIYAINFLINQLPEGFQKKRKYFVMVMALIVLSSNIYTSLKYNNPVYQWIIQAAKKRIPVVFAKEISFEQNLDDLEIGQKIRFSPLEYKDRNCAFHVVNMIPDSASVSGPDYLGAHLSMRQTYAVFPSLYNEADYVIADVFAEKIARTLETNKSIIKDTVGKILKDPRYELINACGNLFVFQKTGSNNNQSLFDLLPFQEKFEYNSSVDYEILNGLKIIDFEIPKKITKSKLSNARFVYTRKNNENLNDFFLFTTFVNESSNQAYQFANIPSFGLSKIADWEEKHFYIEDIQIVLPEYLENGKYKVFVGIDNKIKTRSVYLGEIEIN